MRNNYVIILSRSLATPFPLGMQDSLTFSAKPKEMNSKTTYQKVRVIIMLNEGEQVIQTSFLHP